MLQFVFTAPRIEAATTVVDHAQSHPYRLSKHRPTAMSIQPSACTSCHGVMPSAATLEGHRSCPYPARGGTLQFIIDVFRPGRVARCSSSVSQRLAPKPQHLSSTMLGACRCVSRNIARLPCPIRHSSCKSCNGVTVMHYLVMTRRSWIAQGPAF